ncbi:putative phosphoribosyl transferase [Rhodospirillaceae bacterium LM-1]|nr:putative phosphoribosyl transferase [Rhodospirillaceae bacterium LM-1]
MRLLGPLLDLLLPPQCPSCRALVAQTGTLCPDCWKGMDFLAPPLCQCCGLPFSFDSGEEALSCAACLDNPPPWRQARSVLRYDDASKRLVLALKHADRTDLAPALARWMHRAGTDLLKGCDLIVPVPLHWLRLFARRFNQSALLAHELGRIAGKPVAANLLARTRRTQSQGHLHRTQRFGNVSGAFAVRPRQRAGIQGKTVLLIDDVLTSGATAAECSRVLLKAGAAQVDVLSIARAVLD